MKSGERLASQTIPEHSQSHTTFPRCVCAASFLLWRCAERWETRCWGARRKTCTGHKNSCGSLGRLQIREANSNFSLRIPAICHQRDWWGQEAQKSSCCVAMLCTALHIWRPAPPTQKWVHSQECPHMYMCIYSDALGEGNYVCYLLAFFISE